MSKPSIKRDVSFAVVIIQISLFLYSIKTIYALNQTEIYISNALKKYPTQTIYTCSIDIALKTYLTNKLVNLYYERPIVTEPNSLLLYNNKAFVESHGSYSPNIYFNNLVRCNSLKKIEIFSQNWELYEIR